MRIRLWLAAAALFAGGLALAPAPAAADPPGWRHHDRHDRDDDDDDDYRRGYYGDDDDDDDYYRGHDRRRGDDYYGDRYRGDRGYDRYAYDPYAHNGYYYRDTWYWGPPPRNRWDDCRPGYRRLQTGHRVPRGYVLVPIDDWRSYDLYAPPRGHYWARDERGEYFLLGLAAGVIVDQVVRGW